MGRTISVTNLAQGIKNDNPQPGTLRESKNLLPWRGSLRRRGPVVRDFSFSTTETTVDGEVPEAHYGSRLREWTSGLYGLLGPSSIFAINGELFVDGQADPIATGYPAPSRMFDIDGEVVILPDLTKAQTLIPVKVWSGSRYTGTSAFSGTVSVTANSRHVTFSDNVAEAVAESGYLYVNSTHYYRIERVITGTTAILAEPARATYSGSTWDVVATTSYHVSNAPSGGGMFSAYNGGTGNYVSAAAGCAHQGRVFFGNIREYDYSGSAAAIVTRTADFRWSALPGETDSAYYAGSRNFNSDATQSLDGAGGAILGMASLNSALVFIRRSRIDVATGAFATDGTDVGASINTVANGVGAGGFHAWEQFEGGIAFADEKGVYVWDGSQVQNLTRNSIERAYRAMISASDGPESIIVTCPGGRLVVWAFSSGEPVDAFVFDFVVGGWFRASLDAGYSRLADTGDRYLAIRNEVFNLGGGDYSVRSYDMRGVYEDLDTTVADCAQDEDATSAMDMYLLTNPLPLADGWQQGRVKEIVVADGGYVDSDVTYAARLLRGAIFSSDTLSGDASVTEQSIGGTTTIPRTTTGSLFDVMSDMISGAVAAGATDGAWWRLDDGGTATAADTTVFAHNAAPVTSTTSTATLVSDVGTSTTGSVKFSGVAFPPLHDFSAGGWVKFSSVSGSPTLFYSSESSNSYGISIGLNSSSKPVVTGGTGSPGSFATKVTGTTALIANETYHIVVTYEETTPHNGTWRLYVNGVLDATANATEARQTSTSADIVLGGSGRAIDELFYLDYVVDASTISQAYAAGTRGLIDQRAVKVVADGSEDATHVMLELSLVPDNETVKFAYGVNALGLVVDDNPNYQSA